MIPSVEAYGSIEVVPSCADLSEIVKQDSQHELQDIQPPTMMMTLMIVVT